MSNGKINEYQTTKWNSYLKIFYQTHGLQWTLGKLVIICLPTWSIIFIYMEMRVNGAVECGNPNILIDETLYTWLETKSFVNKVRTHIYFGDINCYFNVVHIAFLRIFLKFKSCIFFLLHEGVFILSITY